MRKFLAGMAWVLVFSTGPVFAGELDDVDRMMVEQVNAVIGVLRDKETTEELRKKKVIQIVVSVFDFDLMARLSLGKKHWMELEPAEKEKFTGLFVKRIQDSYLDKLNLYSDEKSEFEPAKKNGKRIHLQTYLVSDTNRVSVLYKLYSSKSGWKVYDLEIQGVSFVQTFRKQFEGALKTGTVQELIKQLEVQDRFGLESPGSPGGKNEPQ